MNRAKKSRLVKASASAVVALGAIATGIGAAGAASSSAPTSPASVSSVPHRAMMPFPGGAGKVTAVSATSLTITDLRTGASATYAITSSTTVRTGGSAAAVGDIKVGDVVAVFPTATGSTTAATIVILPAGRPGPGAGVGYVAGVEGVVSSVSTTSITITNAWTGQTATYAISSSTAVTEGSQTASASALAVGERVRIGVSATDATSATSIQIELAHVAGRVVSVNGSTVVVADGEGFYRTVVVSGSTTYSKSGASATLADVTPGSVVFAVGLVDGNHTTLDATHVAIGVPSGVPAGAGRGFGPGGGFGPGAGGPAGMMGRM